MPVLKLRKHPSTFSDEDILINPSDYPGLKLNDVVELKLLKGGNANNRVLIQVRKWPENNQSYPNCVSIKDSVASNLQIYADVLVSIIDKRDVLVDSIEICFSNAYLARSYMWGLRNHLNNRCVYQRQKLNYLHINSQICEIWAQGNKASSGYVDDDTKIVFRSASSLVYLFIQMSSEMWDYDINGDLYCEKAINGFLTDLFETWRQNDCSHDITIVLFSRTFYDAETLAEFPEEMRECLQVDYKNRFYEDCYRVAFQNDRFDLHDWNAKLRTLKSLFNQYQKEVINRHQEKYCTRIPRAYNSSAAQGNFLEVLNMSLNVFEKHYFDRSFDRTGQLSVVVSPGVGVFEVDFEMTNLTKQRIIDNGIGSDLVCLGEQPLHTVPLLKFNSKSAQFDDNLATCDVYNMPHWINLSFYSSQNQVYYSNFVPRIKLPTLNTNRQNKNDANKVTPSIDGGSNGLSTFRDELNNHHSSLDNPDQSTVSGGGTKRQVGNYQHQVRNRNSRNIAINSSNNNCQQLINHHPSMPDLVDYDDYDAQVFKSDSMVAYHCQQQQHHQGVRGASAGDRSILADMDPNCLSDLEDDFMERDNRAKSANIQRRSSDVKNYQEYSRSMKRQTSENLPIASHSSRGLLINSSGGGGGGHLFQTSGQTNNTFARMSLVDNYLSDVKIKPESADDLSVRGYNVQSSRMNRCSTRPKALINPFDPSHMTIKLTPNRRRWTHVFPQGPMGTFIQQHHYQPVPQKGSLPYLADVSPPATIPENEMLQQKKSWQTSALVGAQQRARVDPKAPANLVAQARGGDNVSVSRLSQDYRNFHLSSDPARSLKGSQFKSTKFTGSQAASMSSSTKSALVSNDTIRFAWCASGEQEWTPAITTGVDWKSLTMPACLPLTTDFFPSKTSLQNDYVVGEYTIDSSCIHSRYTLIEVYRELVCQRLQKGFQIILLPRQVYKHHHSAAAPTTMSNARNPSPVGAATSKNHHVTSTGASGTKVALTSSSSLSKHARLNGGGSRCNLSSSGSTASTMLSDNEQEKERTEYTLSIGRIFHKLTLNGNTITVTQYRPRHPYPTIKIDYCYRFRAPFHETYGQSWVHFKSEKLENYSWNYLDNYICARGESYDLRTSLKFWRFRILILPSKLSLRKLIRSPPSESSVQPNIVAEKSSQNSAKGGADQFTTLSSSGVRHDIYRLDYSDEERNSLMESFVKLLDLINKTRRASACRVISSSSSSSTSSATIVHNPLSFTSSSSSGTIVNLTSSRGGGGDCTSTLKKNSATKQQAASPTRLIVQIGSQPSSNGTKNSDNFNGGTKSPPHQSNQVHANLATMSSDENIELRWESINMDIDSALRDAKRSEWVHVQYHNFFDIHQAFELVIKWMVASGAGIAKMVQGWSERVGNSSVHVVPCPWEPFAMPYSGKADPLRCPLGIELHLNNLQDKSTGAQLDDRQIIFLQDKILRRFGFVTFHDLISTDNLERQYIHMSGFVFVALPNLVGPMVAVDSAVESATIGLASSAMSTNSSGSSSGGGGSGGFASTTNAIEDASISPREQLASSQLACSPKQPSQQQATLKTKTPSQKIVQPKHGVRKHTPRSIAQSAAQNLKLMHQETISSPHEEYITRHIGGARQNKVNRLRGENEQVEFIWSWNYMLTKRWRSPSTQDELYAVSLLQDFRLFCSNSDGRLVEFWNELNVRPDVQSLGAS